MLIYSIYCVDLDRSFLVGAHDSGEAERFVTSYIEDVWEGDAPHEPEFETTCLFRTAGNVVEDRDVF